MSQKKDKDKKKKQQQTMLESFILHMMEQSMKAAMDAAMKELF